MTDHEQMRMMEFRELLTRMDARLERLESDMEDVRHVLIEGNGRPAMTVRMAVAENELARLTEERGDRKMPRAAWIGIMLSSALGVVGAIISIVNG